MAQPQTLRDIETAINKGRTVMLKRDGTEYRITHARYWGTEILVRLAINSKWQGAALKEIEIR